MKPLKVLFVTTSHDRLGNTAGKTGVWLEELATPYFIFRDGGAQVTIASPKGGLVPLDPKSQSIIAATESTKRFLNDTEAMTSLSHSLPLEEVNADDYDLVFLPGGHGAMWDLADNKILKQLLETFYIENKPIGLVCHGVVSLLSLQNGNEVPLIKGKKLTGFSNSEEESGGFARIVPFLLETKLRATGALYTSGPNYISHIVVDGNIVTGQNPASSEGVARKILALVNQGKHKTEPIPVLY